MGSYNVWKRGKWEKDVWSNLRRQEKQRRKRLLAEKRLNERIKRKLAKRLPGVTDQSILSFSISETIARYKIKKALENGPSAFESLMVNEVNPTYLAAFAKMAARDPKTGKKMAKLLVQNKNINGDHLVILSRGNNEAKKAVLKRKDAPAAAVANCLKAKLPKNYRKLNKDQKLERKAAINKIKAAALRHENCPTEKRRVFKIGFLVFPFNLELRLACLSNPRVDPKAISLINPKLPGEALIGAVSPHASQEKLLEIAIAQKDNLEVIKRLCKRKDCPEEIINIAMRSRNSEIVQCAAKYAPAEMQDSFKTKRDETVRVGLAQNIELKPDLQRRLIKHGSQEVKAELAASPAITPASIDALKKESDIKIVIALKESYEEKLARIKREEEPFMKVLVRSIEAAYGSCIACGRETTGKYGPYGKKCAQKYGLL